DRRSRGRQSLVTLQHGELDDQDRVLRGQAEQRDEADLEVHVVRKRPRTDDRNQKVVHPDRSERAERAERKREQHRKRQRPLFVLRRENEEHHDDRKPQRQSGGAGRAFFLVRSAAPVVTESAGSALSAIPSMIWIASPEDTPGA